MSRGNTTGFLRVAAAGLALAVLLAGCSGIRKSIDRINRSTAAYSELQGFIQERLTTKFHRSVRSVACTPHTDQVVTDSTASFTCLVRFTDGSSYTAHGTVTNPSTDPDVAYYRYSFADPPSADITTAPLPRPAVTLGAADPASLFAARNLAPVVRRLTARFSSHDLIIALAIYPGELEAVIGANGEARAVRATGAGKLTVGPPVPFGGARSGIVFSQLVPAVIQHLTELIAARGGVPLSGIGRFVLTNSLPGGNSGWNIYPASGSRRFQSLVLGDHLVMITPGGTTRALT